MKRILIFFFVLVLGCINAQLDTSKSISFSGFQLDLPGQITFGTPSVGREQLQKFVQNDALLTADLTGYVNYPQFGTNVNYNGTIGGRAYFSLKKKKKFQRDLFVGINFGSKELTFIHYNKYTRDTLSVYTNSSNQKLYDIQSTDQSYNYSVSSKQLLIPFGLNFTTNKARLCWFTLGFEGAIGATFGYRYESTNYILKSQYIGNGNGQQGSPYISIPNYSSSLIGSSVVDISKTGFVSYFTIPASANIRLAKKVTFLKHMNLGISLAPGCIVSSNAIAGTNTGFTIVTNLGLRYNFF